MSNETILILFLLLDNIVVAVLWYIIGYCHGDIKKEMRKLKDDN